MALLNMNNKMMKCLSSALVTTLIGSFVAAATPEFCVPPAEPFEPDAALANEYRREILADYERFWSESSEYIRCLDEERARALRGVKDSTIDYQTVFEMPTSVAAQKIQSGD